MIGNLPRGHDRAETPGPFIDWLLAIVSIWLVGGFYIDLWAHRHGQVDETFFTPWHAALYAGAVAFGVVLVSVAVRGRRRGLGWRDALPPIYRVGLFGVALFVAGGALDLFWHTLFGFEADTEALLSPTHLLLAGSGLIMIGVPLRAAGRRMTRGEGRSWRVAGPFVIALTMGLAIFGAFTQYAHPIVDVWSERVDGPPLEYGAQLYGMAPDGSGQTRLAILQGDVRSPRLSPDGRQLAYVLGTTEGQDTDRPRIHVRALDGSSDRTLPIDGGGFGPAWSPDGSRIAFASRMAGQIELFVIDADGSDLRRLTDTPGDDWGGAWLPDGSGLLFTSNRTGQLHLYRMAADGSDVTALTTGPGNDWDPTLSPDGRRVAFTTDRGAQARIWVANVDGSNPTELATGEGNAVMPAWSPDGGSIAFTSHRTGDEEVFLVAAAGGEPTNLTRSPGVDDGIVGPSWSADGRSILYPSEGATPADREAFVREGLGVAGILIYAAILAGGLTFARRRGRLPAGTYLLLVAVPPILATVLADEWRFIPGAVTAGIIAELLAAAFPPGSSRRADAAFASAIPATFFACYFATVALTTGIGWSIHLWLGSIAIAGIIGLLVDELGARQRERSGAPAI